MNSDMKKTICSFIRSYVADYQKKPEIHTKWGEP